MNEVKDKKNVLIIIGIIVGVLLIAAIAIFFIPSTPDVVQEECEFARGCKNSDGTYLLSVLDGEALAVAETRVAIANSRLNGSGEITEQTCEKLGRAAKNFDESAQWFTSCTNSFTGDILDTDTKDVMELSDGNYCASFTTIQDGNILSSYTFEEGQCGSSRIFIGEPSDTVRTLGE